jgi:HEAT repeat protein
VQQLGELQRRVHDLEEVAGPVTIAAFVIQDDDAHGTDVASKAGFQGPVIYDGDLAVQRSVGATFGSVLLVDPEETIRWHKPGSKYKRSRVDLIEHALTAAVLRDEDPEALGSELEKLSTGSSGRRAKAAVALGALEAIEARAELERAAREDGSDTVREAAVRALAWLRAPESIPVLAAAATDPKRDVRLAAGEVLTEWGNDYLGYPGTHFRHEYTHAMHTDLRAQADALIPAAEALLDDKKVEIRRTGARLLWRLADPRTKPLLFELTEDRDEDVRYAALGGLHTWRREPEVRAAARAHEKDRSKRVRAMATLVLDGAVGKIRE